MATQRQIDANRRNAQKSTGPKTDAGKHRSSLNAFKHGLAARDICIEGEDPHELELLIHDLIEEHQPVTRTECMLVERLAHAYLLSKRARFLQLEYREIACRPTGRHYLEFLPFLHRYHKDHDRAIEKSLEALHNLRRARKLAGIPDPALPLTTPEDVETERTTPPIGFVLEYPVSADSQPVPRPEKPTRPLNRLPQTEHSNA